jgi:hypothetical protein
MRNVSLLMRAVAMKVTSSPDPRILPASNRALWLYKLRFIVKKPFL